MNILVVLALCLGLCLGGCPLAAAAVSESQGAPYHQISEINVFHLKAPENPSITPARPPLPKVTLTGITTILPDKRALLLVQFPPHSAEPGRLQYYVLAPGQEQGPVKVLEIDERTASVRVQVSGETRILTFESKSPAMVDPPLNHN